jgi:hypothetical protein
MPTTVEQIAGRHERRRTSALTARERQDWQDVEALLAEVHQLRSLLAAVVDATPADAAGPTVETARAYLAQPESPTRGGNGRRPTRRRGVTTVERTDRAGPGE